MTRGKILRAVFLPGILPRAYRLFAAGFSIVPFYMAMVYGAVGLLPRGHAYTDSRNMGRFGIRHVITAASANLKYDKAHIDQVIVFFLILTGVVLLIGQFILLIIGFIAHQPAFAFLGPVDILWVNSIYNPGPSQDIAFILLDRIFGVRGIFNSCVSTGTACTDLSGQPLQAAFLVYPSPFHLGLHALFRFYSMGIFIVSVFVIIYYVITITAETAESGVPFGQRLNRTWAPVRLILFAALLVPLNIGGTNGGLNAGQLIVLWAAKWGSNFATNGWGYFNYSLTAETYLGTRQSLVGTPNMPEINPIVRYMFTAKTCQLAENYAYADRMTPDQIQAYIVRPAAATNIMPGPDFLDFRTTTYDVARRFSNYGIITVRFGERNENKHTNYTANIMPYCGEMQIRISSIERGATMATGAAGIQRLYYDMIQNMWTDREITDYAGCLRARFMHKGENPNCTQIPDMDFGKRVIERYQNYLNNNLPAQIQNQVNNGEWDVTAQMVEKGWAGASIWYNRVAEMNGDIANAISSVPQPMQWPYIMETIAQQKRMSNNNLSPETIFDPALAGEKDIQYPRDRQSDSSIAVILNRAWAFWGDSGMYTDRFTRSSGVMDMINAFLGTNGIYQMRRNVDIHPLAQLSALGKGMMQAAVFNFTVGTGLSMGGKVGEQLIDQTAGKLAGIAGEFMSTIGKAVLAMSFTLYYVVPFLPFIYFTFAVLGWVKAIFEAMVAMPLWALAHLRIDGEGMPGPGANTGYFLILEIFLRPILILFGLLASIQIFSALVIALNQVFDLLVQNVGGFDRTAELTGIGPSKLEFKRSEFDQFMFTAMYVVMCYMLGQGCFKLIDEVPNTILRWFGVSAATITEGAGDAADQFTAKTYESATIGTQSLSGGQLAVLLSK